jgi:NitT/TauT family transport system substrate-binding protein
MKTLLLILGLLGSLAVGAVSAGAETDAPIKVTIVQGAETMSTLPVLYAKDAGLFRDAGLDVTWLPVTSNSAQLAALVDSGQALVAQAAASAPFTAQAVGKDIVAFAVISRGGFLQLVLTKSALKKIGAVTPEASLHDKVQALKGLKIALPMAGTTADLQFRAVLQAGGLNPDTDVTLVPNSDLNAVLPSARIGRVDGYVAGPPTTSLAVSQGWGEVWIDYTTGEVPGFQEQPLGVMIAKRATLRDKPEVIARIVKALRAAMHDIEDHPDKVRAVVKPVNFENVDDATFDLAFAAGRKIAAIDLGVSPEGFRESLKTLVIVDPSGNPVSLTFDKVFDLAPLKATP